MADGAGGVSDGASGVSSGVSEGTGTEVGVSLGGGGFGGFSFVTVGGLKIGPSGVRVGVAVGGIFVAVGNGVGVGTNPPPYDPMAYR